MKRLISDLRTFLGELKQQDFPFYMACGYIVFSYLRPQAIYPALDILPWTQLCILFGLGASLIKKQFVFGSVGTLMLLFFSVICFSILYSQYPYVSRSKFDVIMIWFVEVIFFISCVKNRTQFKLILIIFFIAMFKMSLFGARTWVSRGFGFTKWGIAGPPGFFANSGEFSLLMAMIAVLSVGFVIGLGRQKSWYILLPITAVMTVLGASSRGSQIAIIVGLLYLALAYRKLNIKYILITVFVGYLGYSLMPVEQLDRFRNMGSDNTSQSRLDYWEAGWDMMKQYPVLGVGYYGFSDQYERYYKVVNPDDFLSKRKEVSHNSFVEVGSTTGFTGLAIYLLMLGYVYRMSRKVRRVEKENEARSWLSDFSIGMQASLVVYMIGSTFMSVAFYPYIYLLLMYTSLQMKSLAENK